MQTRGRARSRDAELAPLPSELFGDEEVDLNRVSPERMLRHLQDLGHLPPPNEPATDEQTHHDDENLQSPPNPPDSNDPIQSLTVALRQLLANIPSSTNPTTASVHAPTGTTGKPLPKFPDPPVYEGDPVKIDGWVTQTCMYLRAYDIDLHSARAVELASMFLRGKALDWWTSQYSLVKTGQAQPFGSWDDFVKALTETFRPIELARRHTKELLNLTQGKLDMRTYISTFNAARAKVPGAVSDDTLCLLFLQGCRSDLQKSIIVQNPQTLDEYFSLAVALSDFSGSAPQNPSKKSEKSSDKPSSKPSCTHCGKANHSVDQCFKLHPELKRKSSKKT